MIAIRADSSTILGSGHISRCLTLAKELKRKNFKIVFVCKKSKGSSIELIRSMGFKVNTIKYFENNKKKAQEIDADLTIKSFKDAFPNLMILDHLTLNIFWQRKIKNYINKLIVIEDIPSNSSYCDILINQNLINSKIFYRKKNNSKQRTKYLIGPKYALIKRRYLNQF